VISTYQNKALNPLLLTFNKPNNVIWVLAILHVVGIAGFSFCGFWNDWFTFLVPFHLLITAAALILANPEKSKTFTARLFFVGLAGWIIELIGVKTGLIFGNYQYEGALGIKLANVPPIIGVNWILMVYSSNSVLQQLKLNNKLILIITSSIGITLLDILIEPVAIDLNFWSWHNNTIPFQNYIGWFVTAVLLNAILTIGHKQKIQNSLALPVLLMQVGFFGALNLKLLLFGSC
jgi:putative membrane protein